MKPFKKIYDILLFLGFIFVLISFGSFKEQSLDIHLHDTYFVIAFRHLLWILALILWIFWGAYKLLNRFLFSEMLTRIHVVTTALLLLICFGWAINNIENHNIISETENLKPQVVDSLAVEGIIIDEIPGYCGVLCLGGMIKVKLDNNISFNGIDTIYIITACATKNGYKGNRINVKATRLLDTDTECYYINYNRLDNHTGLTFKLSELESGRI